MALTKFNAAHSMVWDWVYTFAFLTITFHVHTYWYVSYKHTRLAPKHRGWFPYTSALPGGKGGWSSSGSLAKKKGCVPLGCLQPGLPRGCYSIQTEAIELFNIPVQGIDSLVISLNIFRCIGHGNGISHFYNFWKKVCMFISCVFYILLTHKAMPAGYVILRQSRLTDI